MKGKLIYDCEIIKFLLVIWDTKEKIVTVAYMKIMATEDKIKRQGKTLFL